MDMAWLRESGEGEGLGGLSDKTGVSDCGAISGSVTGGTAEKTASSG